MYSLREPGSRQLMLKRVDRYLYQLRFYSSQLEPGRTVWATGTATVHRAEFRHKSILVNNLEKNVLRFKSSA